MKPPIFSVIMPVYNASRHLVATIRSVLNQTERDFELILIDDGSTDDSLSLMLFCASQDERVRLVSQPNMGVSSARNLGLDLARGEWIAFMDSDDLWCRHKLAAHRDFHLDNSHISASYAQIAFMPETGSDGRNARTYSSVNPRALSLAEIICENPVCTMSNLVVRKDAIDDIGHFEEGMSYAEDQEWLARLVAHGHQILGLDDHLVNYRLSPSGLSVDLAAMYDGWRQIVAKYADLLDISSLEAIYCRYLSRRALRSGAPAHVAMAYAMRGLRANRQSFLHDPKRGWLTLISACAAHMLPRALRVQIFA